MVEAAYAIERISNDQEGMDISKVFNINIGVLGHIDSGKTSLCRSLSTI
jgi:translation initiation factor 2 gamma subunit (eIF-2gamma)